MICLLILYRLRRQIHLNYAPSFWGVLYKTHHKNPEGKIKNWNDALIISDGRPATQSDFNDTVVRQAIESHLIRLLRANKYQVVCQGRKPTLNAMQRNLVSSLIEELNYFLLKKNLITKALEEEGLEEVFGDELKKLLTVRGKEVQQLTKYETIIDAQKAYIRPGSPKAKGWQITFRDRFIKSLEKGEGYLLVSRNGVLLVPMSEVRKLITDKDTYKQNTIDVYVNFASDKITITYKDQSIDVIEYKLRK